MEDVFQRYIIDSETTLVFISTHLGSLNVSNFSHANHCSPALLIVSRYELFPIHFHFLTTNRYNSFNTLIAAAPPLSCISVHRLLHLSSSC